MAVLDGRFIADGLIDPTKHRVVGTFRLPEPPTTSPGSSVLMCRCGEHLWTYSQIRTHWQRGCFDVPQYQTIDWKGPTTVSDSELLEQLRTTVQALRADATTYVLRYAAREAPLVAVAEVEAICAALGTISVDEALAAVHRLDRERHLTEGGEIVSQKGTVTP